jgi:hypothetical protein
MPPSGSISLCHFLRKRKMRSYNPVKGSFWQGLFFAREIVSTRMENTD